MMLFIDSLPPARTRLHRHYTQHVPLPLCMNAHFWFCIYLFTYSRTLTFSYSLTLVLLSSFVRWSPHWSYFTVFCHFCLYYWLSYYVIWPLGGFTVRNSYWSITFPYVRLFCPFRTSLTNNFYEHWACPDILLTFRFVWWRISFIVVYSMLAAKKNKKI